MKKKKLTSQNKKRIRSVENTLVSTHNTDKRGFVVVALNS